MGGVILRAERDGGNQQAEHNYQRAMRHLRTSSWGHRQDTRGTRTPLKQRFHVIDDETIQRLPFAAALSVRARRELALRGVLRRFPAGATLFEAGSPGRTMFFILEGQVRVLGGGRGRAHVVHTEGAGGGLGEVPALDGGPYPATAVAAEATTCIAFTADAIRAAIAADPSLAWVFITRLGNRIRLLVGRLDAHAAHRLPERLAGLILERHRDAGGGSFGLGGTQTAIAEELGTVREVVVRMLRNLRRAGLIRPAGRGRLEVTDPAALRRLTGAAAPQRPTGSPTTR
jgi:CRP-like cAMP-binding protein